MEECLTLSFDDRNSGIGKLKMEPMVTAEQINEFNDRWLNNHPWFADKLEILKKSGIDIDKATNQVQQLQVAIPSWALGRGGTRFGRFSMGGEPRNIYEKIDDVGTIKKLSRATSSISLHIPWDSPDDFNAVRQRANHNELFFDSINSNTFQDQADQTLSYQFGSLSHTDPSVRDQAIGHNKEVVEIGDQLGSKSLTVWLADGSSYPGQTNMIKALETTAQSLRLIYDALPNDWDLLIEYKPYEPYFYHTVIQDWGTSFMLTQECGDRARCLVDLGHHLPNTNIEQIVATLLWKNKLGGFHFNDSKYGDDDLTVGSIHPFQLFLIFNELIESSMHIDRDLPDIAWMIDASHNLKDPIEDLMQSLDAIQVAYAQALIIDRTALNEAQEKNDTSAAQDILQSAFRTDVRPIVKKARMTLGGAVDPIALYRQLGIRSRLVDRRGKHTVATGL